MSDNAWLAIGLIGISVLGLIYCVLRKRAIGQYVVWGGILMLGISYLMALEGANTAVAVVIGLLGIGLIALRIWNPDAIFYDAGADVKTNPAYTRATRWDFEKMVEKSQQDVAKARAEVERLRGEIAAFERGGVQGGERAEEYRQMKYELTKAEGHLDICETCLRRDRDTLEKWDRDGKL